MQMWGMTLILYNVSWNLPTNKTWGYTPWGCSFRAVTAAVGINANTEPYQTFSTWLNAFYNLLKQLLIEIELNNTVNTANLQHKNSNKDDRVHAETCFTDRCFTIVLCTSPPLYRSFSIQVLLYQVLLWTGFSLPGPSLSRSFSVYV